MEEIDQASVVLAFLDIGCFQKAIAHLSGLASRAVRVRLIFPSFFVLRQALAGVMISFGASIALHVYNTQGSAQQLAQSNQECR